MVIRVIDKSKFNIGMKVKNRKLKSNHIWTVNKIEDNQITLKSIEQEPCKSMLVDYLSFSKRWKIMEQEEL